ncbi:B12-binding domain-containing radical SAM protein [Candidatus Wolfebacteria bacterium RIFOXYD1_FULL_48_65]|uniref:B12-binding domain-containing radical SAM protein n=1 Tax=Candidatus Wolfebacteria bacterium RIFOXYD1_FULL_48_65 TaxID=1802561 RepID=A0A1F8DZC9_9BACT|nr:MAG: B12-binding domain-containing radical SAM protein [Candidatus Wolfebacteria bacterium RIFOXYD1_FULL_48_65]
MKDAKILFIVPPYVGYYNFVNPGFNERVVEKNGRKFGSVVTDMPIGLLSLSAYVKKHADVAVRLIDFNIILNQTEHFEYGSFVELFRDVFSAQDMVDFSPDIIAVSTLFTPAYYNMLDIGRVARTVFPSAFITAGGGVPTNMHKNIFTDSDCFNALCYGEGEKPLLGYIQAGDKSRFLEVHPSWITREKSESGQQFEYDFIHDLDEIPFYDYGLLSPEAYGLSPTVSNYTSFGDRRIFHIATSRGCTNRCCFCASHSVHGRKMRHHSVARVKEDLERLQNEFGATMIGFQDDHFMANKQRAMDIILIAKEMRFKVFFQSGLALYALDRKMLEAIKSAGLTQLVLPVESGSNRVLKEIMHKPVNLAIVNRVITDCRELGIDTDANILIGLPGETRQDIEDSLAYLKTLDANWFRIYIATPLVGSDMLKTCLERGYIKASHIGSDFKHAVITTEEFTPEWLQEKVYAMNLELNFVCNSDVRLGNYAKALQGFENAIRVKQDHALAYYYAALCYGKLCEADKADEYFATACAIVARDEFWRHYADMFNIPI